MYLIKMNPAPDIAVKLNPSNTEHLTGMLQTLISSNIWKGITVLMLFRILKEWHRKHKGDHVQHKKCLLNFFSFIITYSPHITITKGKDSSTDVGK